MDKSRVLEALKTLHQELTGAPQLDGEARMALEQLTADIQTALAADAPPASVKPDEGFSGRLNEAILGFEADHPELTRAVNRVASALADLGI